MNNYNFEQEKEGKEGLPGQPRGPKLHTQIETKQQRIIVNMLRTVRMRRKDVMHRMDMNFIRKKNFAPQNFEAQ